MKPSSRRFVTLILSLILFVLAFVVYASYLKPEYAQVNTLRGTLASKTDLYESQNKILKDVQSLLAKYQGASRIQDTVSLALPNDPNAHILFYQLLNLAKIPANLSIKSLGVNQSLPLRAGSAKSGSGLPTVGTVQTSLTIDGTYEEFKRLLQILATNIRILDVASFTIIPRSETKNTPSAGPVPVTPAPATPDNKYTFSLSVKVYYQSP